MKKGWIQALGAGNGWHWVTLIDDVELPVAHAPGGQSILPATATAGLELSWMTEPGWNHQVERSSTLSGFSGFGPVIAGDGTPATAVDAVTRPSMFYRVGRTPGP